MYCRKYKETDDKTYEYLEDLYEASAHKYINTTLKESDSFERKYDFIRIYEYITYLEDFIQEEIIGREDYKTSIKKLKELKTISILNHKRRDLYTMIYFNHNIEMNPNISKEDSRKILYRRFGQNINRVIE
ncbi:MAG: hypothetical protein Q4E69_01055 [Bacilli bacterium]|nr:hypothetical protein [Bacilli bacterium]